MNQYRIAHGVVVNNDRIHVMGGSASAGDVGSFGVGVKGLEVMDIDDKGKIRAVKGWTLYRDLINHDIPDKAVNILLCLS